MAVKNQSSGSVSRIPLAWFILEGIFQNTSIGPQILVSVAQNSDGFKHCAAIAVFIRYCPIQSCSVMEKLFENPAKKPVGVVHF